MIRRGGVDRPAGRSTLARWVLTVGVCLAVCAGLWLSAGLGARPADQPRADPPASTPETTATPETLVPTMMPTPTEVRAAPAPPAVPPDRLDIPEIDLSTRLIRLGLAEDRTVEVPTDPDRAGWFEPGATPGATGSSVILGHVDSVTGPAVFARLDELERGDVVRVRRTDGSVLGFEVIRVALYDNADFPAQRVYAAAGSRRLNLVTCGGSYDSARGGYQSNLVVFTRLITRS